jgi:uncharacterized membrane protein (UPF0127 family)
MRWLVVAAALVLVSCGDDDVASTTAATATDATAPTPPPSASPTPPTTAMAATSIASPPRTAPASSAAVTTTLAADAVVPQGFEQAAATATKADGTVCRLCLWLAATGDQRALGLMYATDLGGPDGMLFRYDTPTTSAFWMKNTVMPLSIAFYGADGSFLDAFDMAPCTADPCPSYPTPSNFTDAIEVPQGMLEQLGLTPGSKLSVSDLPCQ